MDEDTLQRRLRERPPTDPGYRPRLAARPASLLATVARPHGQRIAAGSGIPFPAARLIAAVAIAALGTGVILFAAGQGPSPAPTASPSLITEPVEPGVVQVLSDGAGHDLAANRVQRIAVGPDGTTWMLGLAGLFRLGLAGSEVPAADAVSTRGAHPAIGGLDVAADGTVWANALGGGGGLASFDGESWTPYPNPEGRSDGSLGISLLPDGSAWAAWETDPEADRTDPVGFRLGRYDGQAWSFPDASGWPTEVARAVGFYSPGFAVTPDGSLWVAQEADLDGTGGALLRFDGEAWEIIATPFPIRGLAAGPDGSVWIANGRWSMDVPSLRLARYDGETWTESTAPHDIRPALLYWDENFLPPTVASDGSVWLRTMHEGSPTFEGWDSGRLCNGLARFDGSTWTTFLADTCVGDIAPGPDGAVWVASLRRGPVYLIRP
jgi:hypothetical protein